MAIDITRASFAGDVLKDEVVIEHANFFAPTHVDYINTSVGKLDYGSHDFVDVCYTPRNAGTSEANSAIRFFQGTRYDGENFIYDLFLENTEANHERGEFPLYYYYVPNPRSAGANGIRIFPQNDVNYLISSGGLSGCSCAFLIHENSKYFIHSGASEDSSTTANPKKRRMFILRDLYNNVIDTSGIYVNKREEPIESVDILVTMLNDLGFSGAIVTQNIDNETVKKYCLPNYNFSVVEYKFVSDSVFIGAWDMFVLMNNSGKYSVGVREHRRFRDDIEKTFLVTSATVL